MTLQEQVDEDYLMLPLNFNTTTYVPIVTCSNPKFKEYNRLMAAKIKTFGPPPKLLENTAIITPTKELSCTN